MSQLVIVIASIAVRRPRLMTGPPKKPYSNTVSAAAGDDDDVSNIIIRRVRGARAINQTARVFPDQRARPTEAAANDVITTIIVLSRRVVTRGVTVRYRTGPPPSCTYYITVVGDDTANFKAIFQWHSVQKQSSPRRDDVFSRTPANNSDRIMIFRRYGYMTMAITVITTML